SIDDIMAEIEADPKMKDVKPPEGMYEELMSKIHEHERQIIYDQLSDEDKELIQLGKVYKKRRKFDRFVVALAAVIVGLWLGSVCIGDEGDVFSIVSTRFFGKDKTEINSDNVEPILYSEEEKVIEEIQHKYGFTPVKLDYLPYDIGFVNAVFSTDMQGINMVYEMEGGTSLKYIIRPNYREASFGIVYEDKKIQEYTIVVCDTDILITEYHVVETGQNRWRISFEYQEVQYLISITNMEQREVEKIVNNLGF
ncbi:MAG: DUF4367 domain-containing protein, partial [Faecalimonas sp.]|nr:DUF4367 domain-containing protein [Faecalimonas sp.]